jgi:transcriptional regulator with XRE-family HTH domain
MLGLSQGKLGQAVGLTFQQIQKYERGTTRVGASRLHEFSQILDVPISFFFDTADPVCASVSPAEAAESADVSAGSDPFQREETGELIAATLAIANPILLRRFFDLAKELARGPSQELIGRYRRRSG